jgi:hypothetical protein
MSQCGISMVRLNGFGSEIAETKLHSINYDEFGMPGIGSAEVVPYHYVASCLANDEVWVLVPDGAGAYKPTDKVRKKPGGGKNQYIESCDVHGSPTQSLFDLPKF